MPTLMLELPETYESISRPIAYSVLDELLAYMNFKARPAIVFLGGQSQPSQPGSTIGAADRKYNMFNAEAKVVLEITEEYPEVLALQQAQQRPNEIVEFHDEALGVYLKPMYQPVWARMSFKIRTEDEPSAIQIQQMWKKKVTSGKQDFLHNVTYHYPIPEEMMYILFQIHKRRESLAGYDETFGHWLKKHFSEKMTVVTDNAGKNQTFAIRENQVGVVGFYSFNDSPPKFEKDAPGGSWSTTVDYTYQYDRVEGMVMKYPLMVHNQLLPSNCYSTEKPFELDDIIKRPNLSRKLFDQGSPGVRTPKAWSGEPGLAIPYFDDWVSEHKFPYTQTLFRSMIAVDLTNKGNVLNLNDLGEWKLDTLLAAYLKDVGNGVFHSRQSAIRIALYDGQYLWDVNRLSMDSQLNIHSSQDLSVRSNYHLVFGLYYHLIGLTDGAIDKLIKHGALTAKILSIIDNRLDEREMIDSLLPDGSMPKGLAKDIFETVAEERLYDRVTDRVRWHTVGTFIINAQPTEAT